MPNLTLQPTAMAQWQLLVKDAEKACGKQLSEQLESYLVLLLQRFIDRPEIAASIFALDFLQDEVISGSAQHNQLRDVGDKCLLFSGLFPERAIHRHVNVSYYVELGQHAYYLLSELSQQQGLAALFHSLDQQFVLMMDTLQCMRELAGKEFSISPLQAEDLWRNTHSLHSLQVLRRYSKAISTLIEASKRIH